jgi:hypothetical protein
VTPDPVVEALDRATADVGDADAQEIRRLMRAALAMFDPSVVTPADQAIEVDAALDVPVRSRVAAARRYAAERSAFALGQRSADLLRRFAAGATVADDAADLLADVLAALDREPHDDVRRELGGYAMECRYLIAGGSGPITTRGAKIVRR